MLERAVGAMIVGVPPRRPAALPSSRSVSFRSIATLSLSLWSAACSGDDGARWLSSSGARSLIIATLSGAGAAAQLEASDLSDASAIVREPGLLGEGRLVALFYDSPLSDLGLRAGRLDIGARGVAIPTPKEVHAIDVGQSQLGHWRTLDAMPPEVAALTLARDPCIEFEQTRFALPEMPGAAPRWAVPLDARRVLVATTSTSGRFFTVTATGATETVLMPASLPKLAAVRDSEGQIWLAGGGGRLVRGHPDTGFVDQPSLPAPAGDQIALAASRGDAPLELFAIDGALAMHRFRDGAWEEIRPATGPPPPSARFGVAWGGEGRAYAIGPAADVVIEHVFGLTKERQLPIPEQTADRDGFHTIAFVDGVGVVAGTRYNRLFVRRATEWELLPVPPSSPRASVLLGLGGGGILSGGEQGVLTEYFEGYGHCSEQVIGAPGTHVGVFAALPGAFFLVYQNEDSLEIEVTVLEP